ncbi:hypothetical protein AAHB59_09405 [Bacillus cereus]
MFGILEGSLVDMLEKVGGDIFGLIGSMNGYTYIYIGSFIVSVIIMIQIKVEWELKSKNIIDFSFYIWLAIILGEAIKLVNNKVIVNTLSSYWIVAIVIFYS